MLESIPGLSPWKVEENPAPFNRTFDLLASGKLPHGQKQLVEFHNSSNIDERAIQARRAYELVQSLLRFIG